MQTELMKKIKPDSAARFALPGKGEGGDDELLLPGQGPRLKGWHVMDHRLFAFEYLGQGINPSSPDELVVEGHSKVVPNLECEQGHGEAVLALVKHQRHHQKPQELVHPRHPLLGLLSEVFN